MNCEACGSESADYWDGARSLCESCFKNWRVICSCTEEMRCERCDKHGKQPIVLNRVATGEVVS